MAAAAGTAGQATRTRATRRTATADQECRTKIPFRELCTRKGPIGGLLADILEIFTGLEADRPAWRDANFLAGPWVTANAALPRLYLEHAEAAQLDPVAPLHGEAHGVEHGIHGHLSLDLCDVGSLRDLVDDVDLDHERESSEEKLVTTIGRIT